MVSNYSKFQVYEVQILKIKSSQCEHLARDGYSSPRRWMLYQNVGIYTRALPQGSVGMNANQSCGFTDNLLTYKYCLTKNQG
ncbi:hypothetical protein [Okeania sp. KiyG1]|uniref:hypothetical protein n=1 Tax=Okeania sp. KiyG1 TaxID=2720165 RepID=UPI001922FA94|nr:hypothetical protein [Okeania sp. KiyG1]